MLRHASKGAHFESRWRMFILFGASMWRLMHCTVLSSGEAVGFESTRPASWPSFRLMTPKVGQSFATGQFVDFASNEGDEWVFICGVLMRLLTFLFYFFIQELSQGREIPSLS